MNARAAAAAAARMNARAAAAAAAQNTQTKGCKQIIGSAAAYSPISESCLSSIFVELLDMDF